MTEAADQSKRKLRCFKRRTLIGGETVNIIVGDEERLFTVHEKLLCAVSDYFRAAFNGFFKEASDRNLELLAEDPETFETFQLWLYTGSILDYGETSDDITFTELVYLYIFAESHFIPKLQNEIVDFIIRRCGSNPNDCLTPWDGPIYRRTACSSPLRKLVVHIAAYLADRNHPGWNFDKYPPEYVQALIETLWKLGNFDPSRGKEALWQARCLFHVHAEGEPKCSGDLPPNLNAVYGP